MEVEKLSCKCKRSRCQTCHKCSRCGCSHDGKSIESKLKRKGGRPKKVIEPKRRRNEHVVYDFGDDEGIDEGPNDEDFITPRKRNKNKETQEAVSACSQVSRASSQVSRASSQVVF